MKKYDNEGKGKGECLTVLGFRKEFGEEMLE